MHAPLCTCPDCVRDRDRIRTLAMGRGQRVGWNAYSLDDPRWRNELTFRGTTQHAVDEQLKRRGE